MSANKERTTRPDHSIVSLLPCAASSSSRSSPSPAFTCCSAWGCTSTSASSSSSRTLTLNTGLAAESSAQQARIRPALIYFHGNGGSIGANAAHACRLSRMGFNVLIFDYRGYGRSDGGLPTVDRVYEDAEQAWKFLLTKLATQ